MIFDAHTHLTRFADDAGPCPEQAARLIARMDRCGVSRALLLGPVTALGPTPDREQVRRANDHTREAVARWPERLSGLCYLNPALDPRFTRDEFDRCVADGPLVGVKLWIAARAADPRLDPIAARAAELDVPILQHAWLKTTGQLPGESTPADVAALARRHPHTRIIMAHVTGCGVRGVNEVADLPNVCVDTSGGQPVRGVIDFALHTLGPERVLFGSDWPLRDLPTQLGKLSGLGLEDAGRAAVLAGNLIRLLGGRAPC